MLRMIILYLTFISAVICSDFLFYYPDVTTIRQNIKHKSTNSRQATTESFVFSFDNGDQSSEESGDIAFKPEKRRVSEESMYSKTIQ